MQAQGNSGQYGQAKSSDPFGGMDSSQKSTNKIDIDVFGRKPAPPTGNAQAASLFSNLNIKQ